MAANDSFPKCRVALVIICEVDENQYLAANFLSMFANLLVEQHKSPSILAKPKEVRPPRQI